MKNVRADAKDAAERVKAVFFSFTLENDILWFPGSKGLGLTGVIEDIDCEIIAVFSKPDRNTREMITEIGIGIELLFGKLKSKDH